MTEQILNASDMLVEEHPYFPLGVSLPGYAANTIASPLLVTYFGIGTGIILFSAYSAITRARPSLPKAELATALWWVLCGFIHLFFEGELSHVS